MSLIPVAGNQVLQWEKMHPNRCGGPRLKKFAGRPQDYSPKARLLNFLGYKLPFDRHDWVVDRCGREVRYPYHDSTATTAASYPSGKLEASHPACYHARLAAAGS